MAVNESLTNASMKALDAFNHDYNRAWSWGANWSNVQSEFETFVNKYLFPKINETTFEGTELGNKFDWLAKEQEFIGQYSEEYVILDSVPVAMNLSKPEELMLKRNYPKMATKLFGSGILKKQKFTLNNNDVRLNFQTLADATSYALNVYKKKVSDINYQEEREVKAMIVDYAINQVDTVIEATDIDSMISETYEALLNLQDNNDEFNETPKASGGALGRYTTFTNLDDVVILTTNKMKARLLDTKIAQMYNVDGLDFTNRIISFKDLGKVYRLKTDVTITNADTINYFAKFGDYQMQIGDIIPKGSVLTFLPVGTEFTEDTFEEIKPETENFVYIFDVKKVRYKRYTKDMLKPPFYNGEYDEVTYWLHYYSTKYMSPFYNSLVITAP